MSHPDWEKIPPFDIPSFNKAEETLHQATQFLAMVGKNYLPHREDDSHVNVGWSAEQQAMLTWPLPESLLQVALHVPSFHLQLHNAAHDVLQQFDLHGSTKSDAFDWLQQALSGQGIPPEKLQYISHYDVPEHPVDKGAAFTRPAAPLLNTWMTIRSNANVVLHQMAGLFEEPSDVRIWPHHFDTGIYQSLPGSLQRKGIGMGLALTDAMFNEPYFYTYAWSLDHSIDYASLSIPEYGGWHIAPDGWNGGFLRASVLFREPDPILQQKMTISFLRETSNSLLQGMDADFRV